MAAGSNGPCTEKSVGARTQYYTPKSVLLRSTGGQEARETMTATKGRDHAN